MRLVIVPNGLREKINASLDLALFDAPADAAQEREALYSQLLSFYDEHGYIPSFSIGKEEAP